MMVACQTSAYLMSSSLGIQDTAKMRALALKHIPRKGWSSDPGCDAHREELIGFSMGLCVTPLFLMTLLMAL